MDVAEVAEPLKADFTLPLTVYAMDVMLTPDDGGFDVVLESMIGQGYKFEDLHAYHSAAMTQKYSEYVGRVWMKLKSWAPLTMVLPHIKIDELGLFGDVLGMDHVTRWYSDSLTAEEIKVMRTVTKKIRAAFLAGRREDGKLESEPEVGSDEWVDCQLDEYFENGIKSLKSKKRKPGKPRNQNGKPKQPVMA